MSDVMTRQMWCERCAKLHRPHRNNKFIVVGSKGLHLRTVERFVCHIEYGFTPHLVCVCKLIDHKTVAISSACGMIECGVRILETPKHFKLQYKHVSYHTLTIADWNALVAQKDFGYKI